MPIKHPLIEVNDLSFAYGNNPVLDHVSFVVNKGDYVGIVGPNGGGKTTLLKILLGLLNADQGSVKINGTMIQDFKQRYEFGYVPQRIASESLNFPATVYELVESGRTVKKGWFDRLNKKDHQAIERALKIAGIEDLQDRLLSDLSGGQRQRAYVARALASEPTVLILDEPFVAIDIKTQNEFYAFLKRLNHEQGLTILFVSHDIDVITEEATSILCLNRGLLCMGKPSLLHEPHMIEHLYGKTITHIHRET